MWLVIKFVEEDLVEAVPKSWFREDRNECFWPPNTIPVDKVSKMILSNACPIDDSWKLYPVEVLGTYGKLRCCNKCSFYLFHTKSFSYFTVDFCVQLKKQLSNLEYMTYYYFFSKH